MNLLISLALSRKLEHRLCAGWGMILCSWDPVLAVSIVRAGGGGKMTLGSWDPTLTVSQIALKQPSAA